MKYKAIIKTKMWSIEKVCDDRDQAYKYASQIAAENPGCYMAVVVA